MKDPLSYEQAAALNQAVRMVGIRHRALADSLLGRLGLHAGQEVLLLQLDQHGPRTQAQLAAGAGCEPPSVTLMVRKLETAGLITREPSLDDRRSVTVSLTPRGRALIPELHVVWQELADTTVAGLAATRTPALIATLTDLAASLDTRSR